MVYIELDRSTQPSTNYTARRDGANPEVLSRDPEGQRWRPWKGYGLGYVDYMCREIMGVSENREKTSKMDGL